MGILKFIKSKIAHEDEDHSCRTQQSADSSGVSEGYRKRLDEPTSDDYNINTVEVNNGRPDASKIHNILGSKHEIRSELQADRYHPPPDPPPSHSTLDTNPPPYESWFSIPDSAQLPPPPSIPNEYSPTNNASALSAELAQEWCTKNQIYTPALPRSAAIKELVEQGHLNLDPPQNEFRGTITQIEARTWKVITKNKQPDMILTSTLPVYLAAVHNPLIWQGSDNPMKEARTVTISFSVLVQKLGSNGIVAVGFTCKPYPPFRLPGWNRGSLAVHSDDGNRYINDSFGGIDLSRPFRARDEVKVTMKIHPQFSPKQGEREGLGLNNAVGMMSRARTMGNLPKCSTQVTFELSGPSSKQFRGEWNVHEERDIERAGGGLKGKHHGGETGIEGLQGEADLYCAVGVCGATEFTIVFDELQ